MTPFTPPSTACFHWPFLGVSGLALLSALALVYGGQDPLGSNPQQELTFTLLAVGCGLSALFFIARITSLALTPRLWILVLALLIRITASFAWPLLEDDYFRYLWDGHQTLTTLKPYQYSPSAFFDDQALAPEWQWVLNGINHPELPTLYGPVLQLLFAFASWLSPAQLGTVQLLLICVDMGIVLLLSGLGTPQRWLLAYAIHPLILKEAIASAHPDLVMALFLLLTLYSWQCQRPLVTGFALGCAIATKVAAVIVIPLLLFNPARICILTKELQPGHWRQISHLLFISIVRSWRWGLLLGGGILTSLLLLYLPFYLPAIFNAFNHTGSELTSLTVFSQHWRFNPLLFRLSELLLPSSTGSRLLSAAIIMASIFCLTLHWLLTAAQYSASDPRRLPPLDLALCILLIWSPVVNNWYWLWLLPLATYLQRGWLVGGCIVTVLGYINSTVLIDSLAELNNCLGDNLQMASGDFQVHWLLAIIQIGVLFLSWSWSRGQHEMSRLTH